MRSTTALSSSTTRIRGGLLVTLDIEPALTYQISPATSHASDTRRLSTQAFSPIPLRESPGLRRIPSLPYTAAGPPSLVDPFPVIHTRRVGAEALCSHGSF